MKTLYTTLEVAKAVGISKNTLLRWLYAEEVPEPLQQVGSGKNAIRVWTEEEVEMVKAYKEANYRKRT